MCDSGSDIRSLQFIDASGCKRFLAGGRVTGCYFVIEDPKNGVPAVSRAMLIADFILSARTMNFDGLRSSRVRKLTMYTLATAGGK